MKQVLKINEKEAAFIKGLLNMSGKEIYDKYGLKEDETIIHTAKFENNIEVDIKLVICDDDSFPYTEGVMFQNGTQIAFTEPDDEYFGEWVFEFNETNYVVIVEEEK